MTKTMTKRQQASFERIKAIAHNLPCRQPRGSPENMIRAYMVPLLIKGLSRQEALMIAVAKARARGLDPVFPNLVFGPGADE